MKPAGTILLPGWLQSQTTQDLLSCIPDAHETVRFVGGCIRDTLLGLPVKDIDLATTYPPQDLLKFIEAKGFKVIPIGIEHGSILAIINSQTFEITTLRKDVETFGRHAKIAFTDDWLEDARRRDFTINALYLSPQGELYDPWGGQEDLKRGSIKFIGDPIQRIQEDYLRILRFFRFLAYFGSEIVDSPSYEACRKFSSSLKLLSRERIHKELLKLCSADNPFFAIQKMHEAKIFDTLFAKTIMFNGEPFKRLIQLEKRYMKPFLFNPLRRLYSLYIFFSLDPLKKQEIFNFSNNEKNYFKSLNVLLNKSFLADSILLYSYPESLVMDCRLIEDAMNGSTQKLKTLLTFLKTWQKPSFPLNGHDILQLGFPASPQVGKYLHEIEDWWIKKDFLPTHSDCLQELTSRLKTPRQ
jgi:poly(A) polymerase